MENRNSGSFAMGAVLLFTVLLVLMLTTFSLLTLSTARSDLTQARLLADRTTAYYEANNQAEQVLAALAAGEAPAIPVTREAGRIAYTIPLNDRQSLHVALDEETLTILQWQVR